MRRLRKNFCINCMAAQMRRDIRSTRFTVNDKKGRTSHVLFAKNQKQCGNNSTVVFFGGDIQDFSEFMENNAENKKYAEWSLENVLPLLYHKFPESDIVVVQPSRYDHDGVFSCYDYFVPSGDYGIPKFVPFHGALLYLHDLLEDLTRQFNLLSTTTSEKRSATDTCRKLTNLPESNLLLIGFSKGCVVLNQVLREFHYAQNLETELGTKKIISFIRSMYFLDGGHGGKIDTWITNLEVLQALSTLGIQIFVHVTPYQINDKRRPWIGKQEKIFSDTLKKLNANITRNVHFKDQPPSLELHFQLLQNF